MIPMITELEISPVISSSRSFIPTLRLSLEVPGSPASFQIGVIRFRNICEWYPGNAGET